LFKRAFPLPSSLKSRQREGFFPPIPQVLIRCDIYPSPSFPHTPRVVELRTPPPLPYLQGRALYSLCVFFFLLITKLIGARSSVGIEPGDSSSFFPSLFFLGNSEIEKRFSEPFSPPSMVFKVIVCPDGIFFPPSWVKYKERLDRLSPWGRESLPFPPPIISPKR